MFFKKNKAVEKQYEIRQIWDYLTSLNRKEKELFIKLVEGDNEPLVYKDVPNSSFLKSKKYIEKGMILKEENNRVFEYTTFKFKDEIYELIKESYSNFKWIINNSYEKGGK